MLAPDLGRCSIEPFCYPSVAQVDQEPFTARLDTDAYGRVLRGDGLWEAESFE